MESTWAAISDQAPPQRILLFVEFARGNEIIRRFARFDGKRFYPDHGEEELQPQITEEWEPRFWRFPNA